MSEGTEPIGTAASHKGPAAGGGLDPGADRREPTRSTRRGATVSETGNGRVLGKQGVLDLSHLKRPEDLAGIERIEKCGAVVVPESLAGAYLAIPSSDIGQTVYVPDNANVRVHTGALVVGGDGLGAADDVVVVTGLLVVTSPVTGELPRKIIVTGSVLAPSGSESALGPAIANSSGSVNYYTYSEGQRIKVQSGQVQLSGENLANPGGGTDDILVAAGQVLITGPVSEFGYASMVVSGQLIAPKSSRAAFGSRLEVQGQTVWYEGESPRLIMDPASYGAKFFEFLPSPVTLLVFDHLTIEPGVTAELLQAKVTGIALFDDIVAPADVVPMLQVLTTDAYGSITAADDPQL